MAKCIFDNLSPKQAQTLAEWFSGQGEQDCDIWFTEEQCLSPMVEEIHPLENGDTLVICK